MKITTRWGSKLPLLLIISLTLSVLSILPAIPAPVRAPGNTTLFFSPDPTQKERAAIFDVLVMVRDVSGLQAYSGMVKYDPTILRVVPNGLSLQDTICDPDVASCDFGVGSIRVDDLTGTITFEDIVLTGSPTGFTGRGGLLKITFEVIAESGDSSLQLLGSCKQPDQKDPSQVCLLDTTLSEIFHKEFDGRFRVGPAILRTEPDPFEAAINTKYDAYVTVDNVVGLFAYKGVVKYNPSILRVQPGSLNLVGTICDPTVAACDIETLKFNDLTGEIFVEITLTGYPFGYSTPPSGRLVHWVFQVISETGISFIDLKSDPENPCRNPNTGESDQWCLLNNNFNEIPHNEDDGFFGVANAVCRTSPGSISFPVDTNFPASVVCDNVNGMFAYTGMISTNTAVLRIKALSLEGSICDPAVAACEVANLKFNDLTGQIFFEVTLTGYPVGFTGTATLFTIHFVVVDDTGDSPLMLSSIPGDPCASKDEVDQICILDQPLRQIPHHERDGLFHVNPAVVRIDPLQTSLPVDSFFDVFVRVDTVRGLFGSAGMVQYNPKVLQATEASFDDLGTICAVAFCDPADPGTIDKPAGTVTWEYTIVGFPRGFSGSNALFHITFHVLQKGASLIELRSSPAAPCKDPATGEQDQVCILDELLQQVPHSERDGLFSVNPPVSPIPVLLPVGPIKISLGDKVIFGAYGSYDGNSPPQAITVYEFYVNGTLAQSGGSYFFSFTPSAVGYYVIGLRVCNAIRLCSILSASTTQVVIVNPPPKRVPVVDFVWDADQDGIFENGKIAVGQSVTFKSTSFDPQDQPLVSFNWDFNGDGTPDASGPMVKHVFTQARLTTVSLKVCNETKLCETEPKDLTINPKLAPTAVINGPEKVIIGDNVVYDGSKSHENTNPPQLIVSYTWTDAAGHVLGTDVTQKVQFVTVGPFDLSLTVCDQSGLCGTTTLRITVNEFKVPPTAVINGPSKVTSGDNVVYDGSKSHDNSNPPQTLTYTWFDKSTGEVLGNGLTVNIHFTIPKGSFDLSLTVCNTSNLCDTANLLITVNPAPFVADLIILAAYATENASFTVSITGGSPPYTCTINFGDGSSPFGPAPCTNGQVIKHVYALAGAYTVQFRATGANVGEDSGTITKNINVQDEPLFIHSKLSWKHHLTTVTQTFNAKVSNPSKFAVTIRVIVTINRPDGLVDQAIGTFTLGAGAQNTNLPFTYNATMLGKYTFTATLQYQVDANGDGVIDVTGTGPNMKTGDFTRA